MSRYVGRFAPTPSGPLHFGSLLTAVASYLDARANEGQWKLRIDDLDTPRIADGATDEILRTLELHGLEWDGPVISQSEHVGHYADALQQLNDQSLCFYCICSRKDLRGHDVYPGTCRGNLTPPDIEAAVRIRAPDLVIAFDDALQGHYSERIAERTGDFIIARRDGFFAYQLAVVVDDDVMAVTHVVRGADLLDNTPRQIFLQSRLGMTVPSYLHLPVLAERTGVKLSKHTQATAIDNRYPYHNLCAMLDLLGQQPPNLADVEALLAWGVKHWRPTELPRKIMLDNFVSL